MQPAATQISSDLDVLGLSSTVTFETSLGSKGQATLVRLTPQSVAFEIYGPEPIVRVSELLSEFEIVSETRRLYKGKALVTALVNTGPATVCDAALSDPLLGPNGVQFHNPEKFCRAGFSAFLNGWQKFYRVSRDYKVVVADLQTFLSGLRLWLEQVELSLKSAPAPERARLESEIAQGLQTQVTSALSNLFERFETVANRIEADSQPAHRAFGRRQLHPHILCAPFIYRTYAKPLGYAGDYEMMNMILRNSLEGASLYAKLVNAYMLDQAPAHAVRNRVKVLSETIRDETLRVARLGRQASVYSIACGPAREVENFIAEYAFADKAQFRLLDFNEETLRYTSTKLEEAKRKHQRNTPVRTMKNSVQSLLKSSGKVVPDAEKHDLIYCSGLYDYLNDRLIKALNTYLYDRLNPGGLLIVGNFAKNNPIQKIMEHALEWFLLYRTPGQLLALAPNQVPVEDCFVRAEPSGTHIFLEVRKQQ